MQAEDLWYKRAIVYCLDVETYMDGNGDGIGDFVGLRHRLDELASLAVNCIWLLPFQPSPNRDNGYDIMDYYGVDPRLGTLGDFVEFVHLAGEYGMRVIIDLVINHTSDQHPWFQAASEGPESPYYDYYVWKEEEPETDAELVFPGQQERTWTYHEQAGAWYLHRFYAHQPDLNIANPRVQAEMRKIMGFWLQMGVSGFRVDAAPYLIEMRGIEKHREDPYKYLNDLRSFVTWRRGDAILMGEVNVSADKILRYFGDGDRMQVLFNFALCRNIFLALARQNARAIIDTMDRLPSIPSSAQWAVFLRNHDELNLGGMPESAQQAVFEEYAPDENMRIFGRGIRRRLAPMFNNDRRQLELTHSLMLSLPGTPVLRYGQEIAMGDDLSLPGRNSVRTPMQWSREPNAGFSTAPASELIRPVISEGPYSYNEVNYEDQSLNPNSFYNWLVRAIRVRTTCPEFGEGDCTFLKMPDERVLGHCCQSDHGEVLALHNLSDAEVTISLQDILGDADRVIELLGEASPHAEEETHTFALKPYGYRWLRVFRS